MWKLDTEGFSLGYQEIISWFEIKIALAVKEGRASELDLKLIREAKRINDSGLVLSDKMRKWLRSLVEHESVLPCDRLGRNSRCDWLTGKAPSGVTNKCPYYSQNKNPKSCEKYRPIAQVKRSALRFDYENKS